MLLLTQCIPPIISWFCGGLFLFLFRSRTVGAMCSNPIAVQLLGVNDSVQWISIETQQQIHSWETQRLLTVCVENLLEYSNKCTEFVQRDFGPRNSPCMQNERALCPWNNESDIQSEIQRRKWNETFKCHLWFFSFVINSISLWNIINLNFNSLSSWRISSKSLIN